MGPVGVVITEARPAAMSSTQVVISGVGVVQVDEGFVGGPAERLHLARGAGAAAALVVAAFGEFLFCVGVGLGVALRVVALTVVWPLRGDARGGGGEVVITSDYYGGGGAQKRGACKHALKKKHLFQYLCNYCDHYYVGHN